MGEDENLMDEQEEEEIYREIEEESPNFELVVNAKDLDILFDKIVRFEIILLNFFSFNERQQKFIYFMTMWPVSLPFILQLII